jgi:hypothetical protein
MSIDEKLSLKLLEELNEIKNSKNNMNIHIKKPSLSIRNIRFYELPKSLSKKLQKKIIKESLILGLREELNHNQKMKKIFTKYLTEVNKLKEKVKKNKDEVQQCCENLKKEFYDRFQIIDNFEKQINLLNEEKKEIIKTNTEILAMKAKQTTELKKQLNKVQNETNEQMKVINELDKKIEALETKKAGLDNEFAQIVKQQDDDCKKFQEELLVLIKKADYYQKEYDSYNKYPEEIAKDDINLFDYTKARDLLTEENLKIDLAEKNFVKDKLLNNLNALHKQIDEFEEKQKEMKKKERLFGKSLNLNTINQKSKVKKTQNNTTIMNTNYSTQSNKRAKTIPNQRKKKNFFGKK